jgi:hypothetical protein
MSQAKTRSRWKRIFLLVLKTYAGLSAVVVTAVLALLLWDYLTPPSASEDHKVAGEVDPKLSLPPIELKYELPRGPDIVDGRFRISPESNGLLKTGGSQPNGAANRGQPVRSETNQAPAATGSHR